MLHSKCYISSNKISLDMCISSDTRNAAFRVNAPNMLDEHSICTFRVKTG